MQESGYHAVSMQSIADKASISVGLIYQYFGNKEDLLTAVIVDILEDFRDQVPAAIARSGDDPINRLAEGFRVFCEIIDAKPDATVLAYRESKTLGRPGRRRIKDLEITTSAPIRDAVVDGIASGLFRPVSPDLVVHNFVMLAHGWALKRWNLAANFSLEDYIEQEFALLLASMAAAPAPGRRRGSR